MNKYKYRWKVYGFFHQIKPQQIKRATEQPDIKSSPKLWP